MCNFYLLHILWNKVTLVKTGDGKVSLMWTVNGSRAQCYAGVLLSKPLPLR